MKINEGTSVSARNKVSNYLVNTLIDQVSDVQEDLDLVKADVENLETTKAGKDDLAEKVETAQITATNGTIGTLTATTVHAGTMDAETVTLKSSTVTATVVDADVGTIDQITTGTVNADKAVVGNGKITYLQVGQIGTSETEASKVTELYAKDINTNTFEATTATDSVHTTNLSYANTSQTKTLTVTDSAEINDLTVTGELKGTEDLSISFDTANANNASIERIATSSVVMDKVHYCQPSSSLDGTTDYYCIILPQFTGTYHLEWKNNDTDVWTATVDGNGCDYKVSWNCADKTTFAITKIFQYQNRVYIRTNSNGLLYYTYYSTEVHDEPECRYDSDSESQTDLTTLCSDKYVYTVTVGDGTISFGDVFIPSIVTQSSEIKDALEVNQLTVNGDLVVNGMNVEDTIDDIKNNTFPVGMVVELDATLDANKLFSGLWVEVGE